jgi:hypothetical protein
MSRVKLMSALAFDLATHEETGTADPVLKVFGELPASAQPFGVNRVYKGPQGVYEEVLALADPDGTVIWESQPRVLELRGMMFEDLFRREVRDDLVITSLREHTLLFYLDAQLVGRVPVFIDAPAVRAGRRGPARRRRGGPQEGLDLLADHPPGRRR